MKAGLLSICGLFVTSVSCFPLEGPGEPAMHGRLADEPLVDVAEIDPTIVIDLRYATPRNITGAPIYPKGTRCLLRRGVAERLKVAQQYLVQHWRLRLKIWDAYRPASAQQILWDRVKNPEFSSDPAKGHSLHARGVAVDVTLVDMKGKDVPMPTDFDDFTPAARDEYTGTDPEVAKNMRHLKHAMHQAGFYGFYTEWWHYMAADWKNYGAIDDADAQRLMPPRRAWWRNLHWPGLSGQGGGKK